MKRVHELISTVFGLGYSPYAPGTAGSIAGLGLCVLLHGHFFLYILVFLGIFAAGVISSGKVEEECGCKDPSKVVIDEFACIFLVFLFVPLYPLTLIVGFLAFRIIDIVKIPPMRSLENIKGGWGIMLDDLVAAVYVNVILQVLIRVT